MAFSNIDKKEPVQFIKEVKALIISGKHSEAYEKISKAMSIYPHSPAPHNLMGILLEAQEKHPEAMSHFRAAYALDATYLPVGFNLDTYGSMFSKKQPSYENSDCPQDYCYSKCGIEYDGKGVGRVILNKDKEYGKD